MGLSTWEEEFCPVEAGQCASGNQAMLEHSLRKWRGAIPANLRKHGVEYKHSASIVDVENSAVFTFNCQSCALCQVYHNERTEQGRGIPDCTGCPLNDMFGGPCCYSNPDPYAVFLKTGNPQPMIEALTKCLQNETSLSEATLNQQEKE